MAPAAEKGEEIPLSPLARCVASAPPIARRHLLVYGFLVALATRSAIPRSPARQLPIAASGGEEGEQPGGRSLTRSSSAPGSSSSILPTRTNAPSPLRSHTRLIHGWAGESVRLSYEKKCAQLRTQDANGMEPFAIERTRAAIRDLRTELNISAAFIDDVS